MTPQRPPNPPALGSSEPSLPALPWVLRLGVADAATAGRLRLWPGVEVGEDEEWLWVRGPAVEAALTGHWWGLPAVGRYAWLSGDRLRLLGSRIPAEKLPSVKWQPIAHWAQVELPVAALPGIIPRHAPLKLVSSTEEAEPDLLLTLLQDWIRFALGASELRLRPLRFAARSSQALLWGRPLPPLPGRRFVLRGRVAVPAGFCWEPAVSPEVLTHRLNVGTDALALWHEDGSFTAVHMEQWVGATRGAVRATADALLRHEP